MTLTARVLVTTFLLLTSCGYCGAKSPETAHPKKPVHYFAHPAVEDAHGVIAPWYRGLNGQCDFRVRVAADGYGKTVDLVFNEIRPQNGLISIRFFNPHGQSAMAQAIEIVPDPKKRNSD